MPKLI